MTSTLPQEVSKYAESPLFDEQTVPDKLTTTHDLKPGVWGKLCVRSGALEYFLFEEPDQPRLVKAGQHMIIEPRQAHFVRPLSEVEFKVEFYR